jgi:hypothetical protein
MAADRELTSIEQGLLRRVIAAVPFPGSEELLAQIPETKVVGGLPMSLHLFAERSAPRAPCKDGPIPVRAIAEGGKGQPLGEMFVWVKDGYLDALEYGWLTDEMPDSMPSPDRIRIEPEGGTRE